MNIKKTIISLVPISLGLGSLIGCNFNFGHVEFSKKTVNLYNGTTTPYTEVDLYFSDTYKGVPYIELNDSLTLLNKVNSLDVNYKLTNSTEGQSYIFNRENGSSLKFDFTNNVIESENLNKFKAASYCVTSLDSRGFDDSFYDESGKKIEGQVKLNTVVDKRLATETACKPTYIKLNDYNIKMYKQLDKYYVPFNTFYDIAGNPSFDILFNGENLFITGQSVASYGDLYYKFPQQARSQALKEYNYNEFCRDLDYNYGLCSEHGITTNFDTYLTNNGIKDLLMSDNKLDEYKAYMLLQYTYFADSHSGFMFGNSYYGALTLDEQTKIVTELPIDPAYMEHQLKSGQVTSYRNYYKNLSYDATTQSFYVSSPITITEDANGYKTLIITFDKFAYNSTKGIDFYYNPEELFQKDKATYVKENPTDTLALISYANDIVHEDLQLDTPKIKNVVLDLSGNTGGAADTAIFTLGWFDSAHMNLIDPVNDCRGSITYNSDINFDKKIDGDDLLVFSSAAKKQEWAKEHKVYNGKVYCLTSDVSFSCGNYVPAMLKQSGLVKLVGTKSGGGACIVHVTGTADGSGLCYSGNKKLCIVRNGSYYSIDEGIDPDYYLNDFSILYGGTQTEETAPSNRANLITYLNSLS